MKRRKVNIYAVALSSFFLADMAPVPVALAEERIFFFGNSYTYYNNGMEKMVKALLEEALNTAVEARATSPNGASLTRHLADLDGTNGDTAARQALITGNNTNWNLVVLQDQSTTPVYVNSEVWLKSSDTGVELNKLVKSTGALTMFLLPWGRQRGIATVADFLDFPKMQDWLSFGYRQYQRAANKPRTWSLQPGSLTSSYTKIPSRQEVRKLVHRSATSTAATDPTPPYKARILPRVRYSLRTRAFQLQSLSGRLQVSEQNAGITYKVMLTKPSFLTLSSFPLDGISQALLTLVRR